MRDSLRTFHVEGIPTTIGFHLEVLTNEEFVAGKVNTRWVEERLFAKRAAVN